MTQPWFWECLVCHREAPYRRRRLRPDQYFIQSLSIQMYRRGPRGRQLTRCKSVRVCDVCLKKAIDSMDSKADGVSVEASLLATAIFQSIKESCNSAITGTVA